MIKLKKLNIKESEIFEECIRGMRNINIYKKKEKDIIKIMEEYDKIACEEKLYMIIPNETCTLEKEDLIKLYENKLSKNSISHAYEYYRQIKEITKRCPYCLIREVKQLDHYLPKSKYPIYSITPNNLVPSCRDCNELKKNPDMSDINNHHLHPYYDDFDSYEYIICKFKLIDNELVVIYDIDKEKISKQLYKKAKSHFELFNIKEIYGLNASSYINSHKKQWKCILDKANEDLLKEVFNYNSDEDIIWLILLYKTLRKESDFMISYLKQIV